MDVLECKEPYFRMLQQDVGGVEDGVVDGGQRELGSGSNIAVEMELCLAVLVDVNMQSFELWHQRGIFQDELFESLVAFRVR